MGWTKGITTCEHRRYTEPIKNDCVMLYNKDIQSIKSEIFWEYIGLLYTNTFVQKV